MCYLCSKYIKTFTKQRQEENPVEKWRRNLAWPSTGEDVGKASKHRQRHSRGRCSGRRPRTDAHGERRSLTCTRGDAVPGTTERGGETGKMSTRWCGEGGAGRPPLAGHIAAVTMEIADWRHLLLLKTWVPRTRGSSAADALVAAHWRAAGGGRGKGHGGLRMTSETGAKSVAVERP